MQTAVTHDDDYCVFQNILLDFSMVRLPRYLFSCKNSKQIKLMLIWQETAYSDDQMLTIDDPLVKRMHLANIV